MVGKTTHSLWRDTIETRIQKKGWFSQRNQVATCDIIGTKVYESN